MEKKRKTFTSSAVKKRYNDKTYKHYSINFRYDSDAELIAFIEAGRETGAAPSDTLRALFRHYQETRQDS